MALCAMDGSSIGGFRNAGGWPDDYGESFDREPAGIFKNSQARRTCIVRHGYSLVRTEVRCTRVENWLPEKTAENHRRPSEKNPSTPSCTGPHRGEIGGGISTLQLTGVVHPKICLRAHSCSLDTSFFSLSFSTPCLVLGTSQMPFGEHESLAFASPSDPLFFNPQQPPRSAASA